MHPVLFEWQIADRALAIGGYGVMLCLALALGAGLALRAALRAGLDEGATIAALGMAVAGGFAGALVLHGSVRWITTGSLDAALASPGLAFLGAALGGVGGLCWGCRVGRLPALRLLDLSVPAVAAAHALGRVGCLLGGCCFGAPTASPLALHYTDPRAPAFALSAPLHPVQLYEALVLCALALGFAAWPYARVGSGRRTALYAALYCAARIVLETLRGDSVRGIFSGVSTSQALSVAVLIWLGFVWARRTLGAVSARFVLPSLLLVLALCPSPPSLAEGVYELIPSESSVVSIQGGWFAMGSDEDDIAYAVSLCRAQSDGAAECAQDVFSHEHPRHRVFLSPYAIDRREVDNGSYRRCVRAGACRPARTADQDARVSALDQPVAGVTWEEARRYCRFAGGQLPTEAQWEYAARGASLRRFPWGFYWNSRVANHAPRRGVAGDPDGYPFAAPVFALPDGRSAHGLLNMAGNVWELTADRYDGQYYERSAHVDPLGPEEGAERVMRGGSWRTRAHELRVTHRASLPETEDRADVGFRCAYNVP